MGTIDWVQLNGYGDANILERLFVLTSSAMNAR